MSSLSAFYPSFRLNLARLGIVGTFAVFLVGLGFLVPFWIVVGISAGLVAVTGLVRSFRRAARTVDDILTEELGPRSSE